MQKNDDFVLTNDNYYSPEANWRYMSVHQYLDFVGHMGVHGCEKRAMAALNGEYEKEKSTAMLVGSYVDSYFEGSLERFKEENPDIFTQKGELKAAYKQAEKMIARAERDEKFMAYMSGEKQVIMTGYLFGCDWKIKIDSYIPHKAIIDLKTTADLHKAWRVADYGYASVAEYWAYTLQMAVYQKIVEINTGEKLPCILAFITKEDSPELKLCYIDQMTLDHSLNEIEMNMPGLLMVKSGEVEPIPCGKCDYCKATEPVEEVINIADLIEV